MIFNLTFVAQNEIELVTVATAHATADSFTIVQSDFVEVVDAVIDIISDIEKCADDIVYISKGKIVAAMPEEGFMEKFSEEGETLEDTMLRMERGDFNE